MRSTHTRHLRLGVGLVAMAAVMALVVVLAAIGGNGGTKSVSAIGTPTPDPAKPAADGNLSGIYDLQVLGGPFTIYHCISRMDHEAATDDVKIAVQCYSDTEIGDPANVLSEVYAYPNEVPDGIGGTAGPPVPPPYTNLQVFKGLGKYDATGAATECAGTPCVYFNACVARTGAGSLGPNLLIRAVLDNPKAGDVDTGTAELYPGANNKDCDNLLVPTGGAALPLTATSATAATPVAWRTSATDFDGDGCTDFDELSKHFANPKGCGDDPYNPGDSNETDFSGGYSINVEVARADVTGGLYFSCLADIVQDGTGKDTSTTTPGLEARVFCYTDGFSVVNALGYPGVQGDGFPGGGPAWGAIPQEGAAAETICTRFGAVDEDADTVVNDGCPSDGFNDVDSEQTALAGYVDNADNTLKIRGCFKDEDASSSVGNTYVEMAVNRNTGVGAVDIWALQDPTDCAGSYAFGGYSAIGGVPPAAFNQALTTIVRQPGPGLRGHDRDTDQDGATNAEELRDDGADCGLRDPYNPYDWYDVNSDGVIDLLNDILGVIQHYQPAAGGAPPYDILFDRPAQMSGGAGSWNRGAPDGVIDLLNDILGVIQQYHPAPC